MLNVYIDPSPVATGSYTPPQFYGCKVVICKIILLESVASLVP